MSPQRRRFLDLGAATPTFIGAESVIVGNIRGTGLFVVSGEIHGDGEIKGGLNLSVTGRWHGFIEAQQACLLYTSSPTSSPSPATWWLKDMPPNPRCLRWAAAPVDCWWALFRT